MAEDHHPHHHQANALTTTVAPTLEISDGIDDVSFRTGVERYMR